jgi:hypothetical protein
MPSCLVVHHDTSIALRVPLLEKASGTVRDTLKMERTQKHDWLIAQGYRTSTLPPVVTWYTKDRELKGRTDDYTLGLYRSKGFVLDRKCLDPHLWHELEYGVNRSVVAVAPPEHSGTKKVSRSHQKGYGREGFLAGNPLGVVRLDGCRELGYVQVSGQIIHRGYEASGY